MTNINVKVGKSREIIDLPLKGYDNGGHLYGVNNRYLKIDDKPILPIMGEFHFSRYPEDEWEEEIKKMKEGGIDIIATYLFWIHHEEEKGGYNFEGCRNIRKFLQLCQKNAMPVWLRIGPWAHGECRNGGFPDWLVEEFNDNGIGAFKGGKEHIQPRTDNPQYLRYVRRYWSRLSHELEGMFAKDGGSIIGIQLENEYCHVGGPSDKEEARKHMMTLKKLAVELGFEVPWYTATGWGGAIVIDNEMLPVFGGYVDAPWGQDTNELPACENFLFQPYRDDKNIGSDLAKGDESRTFSKEINPYLTAELGGGLQVTKLRRTYPFVMDTVAQAFCILGSGANLLGYYMYHGGVNPDGKFSTLQESKETGYLNDLPKKCYDFAAPLRESGLKNVSYFVLKDLHEFVKKYERELAESEVYLPDTRPADAEDMTTPRVSVRYDHKSGMTFIFINAHQRKRQMKTVKDLRISLEFSDGKTKEFGNLSCPSDCCRVYVANGSEMVSYTFNAEKYIKLAESEAPKKVYEPDCKLISGDKNKYLSYIIDIHKLSNTQKSYLTIDFNGDRAELYIDDKLLTDWFSNGENWTIELNRYLPVEKLKLIIYPYEENTYYDLEPKKGCGLNKVWISEL